MLPVGFGFRLFNPATEAVPITFVGGVLNGDGSSLFNRDPVPNAPALTAPGNYLMSWRCPGIGYPGFENIVGAPPQEGDTITTFDNETKSIHVTQYTAGSWDNGELLTDIARPYFFSLGGAALPAMALGAGDAAEFTTQRLLPNGNPKLTFTGTPGATYIVRRTASLGGPATAWNVIGAVTTDGAGTAVFEDADPGESVPRFYRAVAY